MSKRQVIILWSIAAVLALLVLTVKLTQRDPDGVSTERKPGETLFAAFPAEKITRVVIQGAQQSLTLEKSGDEWLLKERDNYPADTTAVLELIRTLNDLEVNRTIEASPSLAPRFGMDSDSDKPEDHGLEISLFDKDKEELAHVTLGKNIEHGESGNIPGASMLVGRYIRNHADPSGFYAINEMFPSVSDEAKLWLRDTFISPEKIESIEVTKTDGDETEWHLQRRSEEAAFQVVEGKANEVANNNLANRLSGLFSYARFQDVVPTAEVEKRSGEKGRRKAVIKTFEGFTYSLSFIPTAGNDQEYLLQVMVDAKLPTERKKEQGESEEDAAKKDKAFSERLGQLQDKLNEAKFFEGRSYLMNKSDLDLLLHNRGDIVISVAPKEGAPPPLLTAPQP